MIWGQATNLKHGVYPKLWLVYSVRLYWRKLIFLCLWASTSHSLLVKGEILGLLTPFGDKTPSGLNLFWSCAYSAVWIHMYNSPDVSRGCNFLSTFESSTCLFFYILSVFNIPEPWGSDDEEIPFRIECCTDFTSLHCSVFQACVLVLIIDLLLWRGTMTKESHIFKKLIMDWLTVSES